MASSIEVVLNNTKNIESLITKKFSPVGKGLIEKVKSIEYSLPASLAKDIKHIGRIRNKFAHDSGFSMSENDILEFVNLCNRVILEVTELEEFQPKQELKLSILPKFTTPENDITGAAVGYFFAVILLAFSFISLTIHIGLTIGLIGLAIVVFIAASEPGDQRVKEPQPLGPQWDFYQDKFIMVNNGEETTIPYSQIKSIRLDDARTCIRISTTDRGVSELWEIKPSNRKDEPVDLCKQIYGFVFRDS